MRTHEPVVEWNARGFIMTYRGFEYHELNALTEYRYFVGRESADGTLVTRWYDGDASHTVEGSKHAAAFMKRVDAFYA